MALNEMGPIYVKFGQIISTRRDLVAPDIAEDALRELALAAENVQRALDGRPIRTVVVRAPKLVNVVPG